MVRLTVVPVIPLALSEAMKTAMFAISSSVDKPACVGPAREQLLELFPGHSRCLGVSLEGFLDRARLRHPLWSQTDHANALRCELGGQVPSECLHGGHRRTAASHQWECPSARGVEVTVMITPDPFATIRRAARRAVRKYDLVYVAIGRENCSTSSSTRGTPESSGSGCRPR